MCRTYERKMIVSQKILIMGLPGAGKTSLAKELAPLLNAVHFNADVVRKNINSDLGFSNKDRIEQARRMGWMCDQVTKAGGTAVADFICPTPETRAMFGATFTIWVNRIKESRFRPILTLYLWSPTTQIYLSQVTVAYGNGQKKLSACYAHAPTLSGVCLYAPIGDNPRLCISG